MLHFSVLKSLNHDINMSSFPIHPTPAGMLFQWRTWEMFHHPWKAVLCWSPDGRLKLTDWDDWYCWWFVRKPVNSPVEGTVVYLPLFTTGFSTIPSGCEWDVFHQQYVWWVCYGWPPFVGCIEGVCCVMCQSKITTTAQFPGKILKSQNDF